MCFPQSGSFAPLRRESLKQFQDGLSSSELQRLAPLRVKAADTLCHGSWFTPRSKSLAAMISVQEVTIPLRS
jgi:hypothetical protein